MSDLIERLRRLSAACLEGMWHSNIMQNEDGCRRNSAQAMTEAAAELERLRADAARLDWLSTGGNWIRPEEIYDPAPGYSLRQFIDDCMTPPKDTP